MARQPIPVCIECTHCAWPGGGPLLCGNAVQSYLPLNGAVVLGSCADERAARLFRGKHCGESGRNFAPRATVQ